MRLTRPPGLLREGSGSTTTWRQPDGSGLADPRVLERLRRLRVPPGWRDVWAASDPAAAVQATGVDSRGRTQYRYLPLVAQQRSADKFAHLAGFGQALPQLRRSVAADLAAPPAGAPAPTTVLAAMVRLLDLGFFRVGNARYARDNHTYGLSTLLRHQVVVRGDTLHFDYVAKEHVHRVTDVHDAPSARVVAALLDAPGSPDGALFRHGGGTPVTSAEVNAYIHSAIDVPASAKEFRTWSGTVVAAASLAGATLALPKTPTTARLLAVAHAAALLGNSPAVARAAYVHPAVLDAGPDPGVSRAVQAVATRQGSADLLRTWTDPVVQAAVARQLQGFAAG